MEEIKKEGKVRHVAISSSMPFLPTFLKRGVFDTFQIPYSALERFNEGLITQVADAGCGVIVRGGVARGEPGAGLGGKDRWAIFEKAKLDELLAPGENRTMFLMRFTIAHPGMHTTIVGTKNVEHLNENIRAAQAGPLAPDVYAEAKRRLTAAGEVPMQEG
jgi:aryl-alcohol dehydrogenase-like predicted oxidoreductase